jgi:hypothetical protein
MANRSRTPILALNVRGNLAATDENNSDSVAIFLLPLQQNLWAHSGSGSRPSV